MHTMHTIHAMYTIVYKRNATSRAYGDAPFASGARVSSQLDDLDVLPDDVQSDANVLGGAT